MNMKDINSKLHFAKIQNQKNDMRCKIFLRPNQNQQNSVCPIYFNSSFILLNLNIMRYVYDTNLKLIKKKI